METMTLEELRTYLADMEPEDVAVINAALDAALRERDELRDRLDSALGDRIREFRRASGESRRAERAERAEAELAALKARIADAPVYEIPLSKPKSEDGWARVIESVKNERSVRGKRVRLVKDDD